MMMMMMMMMIYVERERERKREREKERERGIFCCPSFKGINKTAKYHDEFWQIKEKKQRKNKKQVNKIAR